MTALSPKSASSHSLAPAEASAAHFLLEGLMDAGMRRLFCNLGTDHVSIIEELAAWKKAGRDLPEIFLCPHENVAVHMAGGFAAATGNGQAVLVHVDAGTANSAMALHNLFRGRLPVMLIAGQAPYTVRGERIGTRDNYVHFVQDPFDIGSLVRPYVKWEYALPDPVVAKEVVRRAHSVMQSDPPGPVFLTLPRETLAQRCDSDQVRSYREDYYGPVAQGGIDSASASHIAEKIRTARSPIIITSYLGRSARAVHALQRLSETAGIPVYEANPTVLNLSRKSPAFAGFQADEALKSADLVLLLDVDVPWLPKYTGTIEPPYCIQIDTDAIKADFPLWGFGAHMRLQANTALALEDIHERLQLRPDPAFEAQARDRLLKLGQSRQPAPKPRTGEHDLDIQDVLAALEPLLNDCDIVVNEAIRNAGAVLQRLPRTEPGTYFCNAGGGLGYSGGFALGLKLATPGARVVQIVGDGSFHFCAPTAVYATAAQYGLPILTLVLDNGGWRAVKESVLRVHMDGDAAETDEFQSRLQSERRDFELVGQAFGAHAEAVEQIPDLEPALRRSLAAIDNGRSAVLRVRLPQI